MNQTNQPQIQPCQIRVFISSTFRDMAPERDQLVKFVFPQMRKLCESRGVVWGEVDLRWGITNEQSAEGQVLPLCLAEIQRCRPYFIGLLGERYGWIPDEIDPELMAQEPWLAEHLGHSVTELEILHGVLKDPQMADKALFYFRDPAYLETLDADQLDNYIEVPWRDDIEQYGMAEAQRRVGERQAKLSALKDHIRESALHLRENYRNPQELGEWVLADLTEIINGLYPEGSQPDPLVQEAMLHEAFAKERARVYIGGQKYYARLDEHIANSRQPLVVVGESGSGKSALLANWALKRRTEYPDELVLMHFLGASAGSTNLANMLARLMDELQSRFDIPQELPGTEAELRSAFPNWLYMAAAQGRGVLLLDGLNQLDESAQELDWLPQEAPECLALVLSSLPGRALDVINERGWPSLAVEPLAEEERAQLVQDYLAQYAKGLSPERVARIVADPQSENPLGLRVLLEELRQFGVHERLDEVIDRYLAAESIPEMYRLVLERCEADYEDERPGLVGEALSCIWAARRGLSEGELLELLGEGGQPLPHRVWSPLYLALAGGLVDRGGLLTFFHDYLRQAVETKYLTSEKDKENAHISLVGYFSLLDITSVRKLDELPWHLSEAKQWGWLCECLWNLEMFQAVYEFNRFDLFTYWTLIELNSDIKRTDAFQYVINKPIDVNPNILNSLYLFFFFSGNLEFASQLAKKMKKYFEKEDNLSGIALSLNRQAAIFQAKGKLSHAMELSKRAGKIFCQLGNNEELFFSLSNQAIIHYNLGELGKAMELNEEQERIGRQIGNLEYLIPCLGNQAMIMRDWGKMDEAMELMKEQEQISRQLGNKYGLQASLNNQATILQGYGQRQEAMALYKEVELICRELGNKDGLARSLGNQAGILQHWRRMEEAMALHKQEECLYREMGNKDGVARTMGNQALILADWGRLEEALALHKEGERICRELGNKNGLALSLSNQGSILNERSLFHDALEKLDEAEGILTEIENLADLFLVLGNKAITLIRLNKFPEALKVLNDSIEHSQIINFPDQYLNVINAKISLLSRIGEEDEIPKLLEEEENVYQKLGDYQGLCQNKIRQALCFKNRKLILEYLNSAKVLAEKHYLFDMLEEIERLIKKIDL